MVAVSTQSGKPRATPDLSEYRRRYPLTVASFGALADREGWLDRIWEQDARWLRAADEGGRTREAVVRSAPPAGLMVEGEFEIISAQLQQLKAIVKKISARMDELDERTKNLDR